MADKSIRFIIEAITSKYERQIKTLGAYSKREFAKVRKAANDTGKFMAKAFISGAVLAAGALTKFSLDASKGFEQALFSMANVTSRDFGLMKKEILALNPALGKSEQLMRGYYQTISAGVTDPKKALETLTVGAQVSSSSHIEQSEVIKGLTKVMAGYEGQIKTASDAADLLYAIEKEGQTSVAELIPVIGGLAKVSNDLGISQTEMGAAFAQITQTAGSTEEAAVQYQGILLGLMKATPAMTQALHDMGYATAQDAIKSLGLANTLELLKKTTGGSADKMAELFTNVRGLKGVSALAASGFKGLNEKIVNMSDRTGKAKESFDIWAQSTEAAEKTFTAGFGKFLIKFGDALAPTYIKALKFMSAFTNAFGDDLISATKKSLVLVDAIDFIGSAIKGFANAWQGLKLIATGAIAGIAIGIENFSKPFSLLLDGLVMIGAITSNPLKDFKESAIEAFKAVEDETIVLNDNIDSVVNRTKKLASEISGFSGSQTVSTGGEIQPIGQELSEEEKATNKAAALLEIEESKQRGMLFWKEWARQENDQINDLIVQSEQRKFHTEQQLREQDVKNRRNFVGNISKLLELAGQHSKKAFKVFKAVSLAQAIVGVASGAATALKLPYPYNLFALASTLAAGLPQIATIVAAEPGGGVSTTSSGGGGSVGSIGSSYSSDSLGDIPSYADTQEAAPKPTVTIIIEGDMIGDEAYVEGLAEKISEMVENKNVRLVASNSKTADSVS